MSPYLTRRLLLILPTLFILSILVFLSVRFIPGDMVDTLAAQIMAQGTGNYIVLGRKKSFINYIKMIN